MADRMELNEEALEDVNGGKFSFYSNSKGQPRVNITGIGVYACSADGFIQYINMKTANPDASEEELFNLLKDAGVITGQKLA